MGGAGDAGSSATFEEVVEQTRGPRARILDGLRFYDDEAHAQQLRRYGDIPSGRYHFNKLQEQGMIEKTGEEHIGRGGTATVYQLTELGREIADALDSPSGAETITQLQDDIEELQQRYNDIADFVEDLDERMRDAGL
jgi:predicted ArsR family transcriptional regulator